MKIKANYANEPLWKELKIKSRLPEEMKCLDELAHNMWWAWHSEVCNMWKSLDEKLYEEVGQNPVLLLERLSQERKKEIVKDEQIMQRIRDIYADFRAYMDKKPDSGRPSVAYFSMEYGINQVLKIYSGGLGMLAGDYLKEASDSNVDMCAVGFMYRYGYFKQSLNIEGRQIANYEAQNFNSLPIERQLDADGNPLVVDVPFMDFHVYAYVWRVNVGRIPLYLLDTDNEMNSEFDKSITHNLYGGDWENRLKQEILLGIGGIITLKRLGITKDIYHCNEGHAALCNLQRICDHVESGLTFNQAMELVKASSIYTCHTPVPAGHDYFDEQLFGKYMRSYPGKLGISWEEFIGMGRVNPSDPHERFSMSTFACNTCQEVNGVSRLHGWVSRKMFAPVWKGYYPEENHVGYVTNGVHFPSWTAHEWRDLYDKYFDKNFINDQSNEKIWHNIYKVPDEEIWETRMALKKKLVVYIREKFRETWLKNQGDPSRVVSLLQKINPDALMIGFCRRFATYKRAHLLFTDLERLEKIVNNPDYPVQFIFSGKAHPADGAGQDLIKKIYDISRRPEFLGKIIFLEDYDFLLARRLVSGVDIWMNTPTRPLEASGTSGEKAEMNGVVNLSVLDGWWLEGYREGAGWALTEKRTYENQDYQDKLDAATIYGLLENEIIPMFYARRDKPFSEDWVKVIKNSIATIAPHYTMKRQLDDYFDKFYNHMAERSRKLHRDNYRLAKELAQWKETVAERWDAVKVISKEADIPEEGLETGKSYRIRYIIDEQGLDDAIGLEFVSIKDDNAAEQKIHSVRQFKNTGRNGNLYTFECIIEPDNAGTYKTGIRMYPKNDLLPHRQDFCYVRWLD